jgi:hypothetical protein
MLDLSELIVGLIGLGLSLVTFWLLLWPRVKAIAPRASYVFAGSLFACFPIVFAQQYLNTVTGKLTAINSVTQINTLPITHYYTIKKYYADKYHACSTVHHYISGRSTHYYNVYLYVLIPIIEDPGDTLKKTCDAWLGYQYRDKFDNDISTEQRETLCKDFMDKSWADFDKRDFSAYSYFE